MFSKLEPSLNLVLNQCVKDLNRTYQIIIFCECEVRYTGRAVSNLSIGQRTIFIKPDKTVFVHQISGRNPVNWMPEKSVITLKKEKNNLIIIVESVNPREILIITISNILIYSSCKMSDSGRFKSIGSEADMAKRIYDSPKLISEHFIPANLEEQTKYGFIDVLGKNNKNELIVIECKRYKAGLDAVQQLRRYVERLKKEGVKNKINGIIAAPQITKNAHKMLIDWGFKFKEIHPPMYLARDKEIQETLKGWLN